MCGITGDAGLAVKNRATGEVYHPTATSRGNKNTDAGNADVAVDDASHEDLSALAAKLDTLGLEPAAAAAAAPAPADTAGPIPLRAIRASGPPLSDVQFCPGARIVSHTSTWYRIACMPESVAATLICTRRYQDLVAPTALAGDWTAILAAEESSARCCFYTPRVRKVLWPQAVVAGDTYELRSETVGRIATSKAGHDDWQGFIEASFTRLQLPECTGEAVQSDSISWHIARGSLRSAPVCATCYQDHLATTPFAEHFRTYHPRLDNHLLRRGVGHDFIVVIMSLKAAITLAISFSAILASSATVDKRIVNGEDADFGEIKFIVTLCEQDGECYCGGSLLDSTTVLTAAHCVDHSNPISIKAGILFRGIGGGVDAQPASIIKHPNYRAGYDKYGMIMPGPQQHNDIAILKLATPIDKSSDIDYATLPPAGSDAVVNSTATAAGWGRDIPDKPTANVVESPIWLQKVVLPIRAREDCAQYENVGERDTIICAGGGGKNVCGGDSGGPLFDAKTGQLLGVVSMATKDKDNDEEMCNQTPGVFTRVGSYIDFINEHLGSKTKQ